jgi:2-hydroxy-6-oxonona-2,4-dienedioate hydrolase
MDELRYRTAERALWSSVGCTPTEHRVHLPANDVTVRVQEVGSGPTVLFLHGGPNSGSTWAPVVGHLDGLRCLLVDRPGTGLSDPLPRPLTVDRIAPFADGFVADVLDAVGVDRAHLVGSSFGGYLALRSAAAHPDRVDRMVQMACPAFAPGMRMPPFMRLIALRAGRWLLRALPPTERAGRSTLRQLGHGSSLDAGRISQPFMDWYLALQRHTDTMAHEVAMIASAARWRGFDERLTLRAEELAAVAAPTAFLWGADDTFGGAEVATEVVEAMADAMLSLVPESGHLPWIDDPAAAAAFVTAHLAAVEPYGSVPPVTRRPSPRRIPG